MSKQSFDILKLAKLNDLKLAKQLLNYDPIVKLIESDRGLQSVVDGRVKEAERFLAKAQLNHDKAVFELAESTQQQTSLECRLEKVCRRDQSTSDALDVGGGGRLEDKIKARLKAKAECKLYERILGSKMFTDDERVRIVINNPDGIVVHDEVTSIQSASNEDGKENHQINGINELWSKMKDGF